MWAKKVKIRIMTLVYIFAHAFVFAYISAQTYIVYDIVILLSVCT